MNDFMEFWFYMAMVYSVLGCILFFGWLFSFINEQTTTGHVSDLNKEDSKTALQVFGIMILGVVFCLPLTVLACLFITLYLTYTVVLIVGKALL